MRRVWAFVIAAIGTAGGAGAAPLPERLPPPRELNTDTVIASLVEALGDRDDEVRSYLGAALASYGREAAPRLIRALRDDSPQRRSGAAYALSQMRPAPADALPTLLQALKDPEEIVRRQAAYAISRITRSVPHPVVTEDIAVPPPDPTPGVRP